MSATRWSVLIFGILRLEEKDVTCLSAKGLGQGSLGTTITNRAGTDRFAAADAPVFSRGHLMRRGGPVKLEIETGLEHCAENLNQPNALSFCFRIGFI
ncbi:hypothetical protein FB480_102108 [Agrobacterium vitis]|nr:hypothetical protein FB480_102108 [Agrobacterium vitis]